MLEFFNCSSTVTEHSQTVWNVAWSPNGLVLASCGGDQTICLWSIDNEGQWKLKAKLVDAHERTIRRVAWSPDGRFILAASFDATTSVWENQEGGFAPIAALEGHENEVKAAAFDSSGAYVATCSRDKSVWIWEMAEDAEFECVSVLYGHGGDVKNVVWHPFDAELVSCSYDDTIKVWREGGDDWYCAATLQGHESTVWDISFDRSGERLASASDDGTIRMWRRRGGEWEEDGVVQKTHARTVYACDWARTKKSEENDEILATGAADDRVRVLAAQSPYSVLAEGMHGSDVNCVRWNPRQEGLLASCSDDKSVKLWMYSAKE